MKKITAILIALLFIAAGLSAQAPLPAGTKRPWTNVVGAEWPRVDAQLRVHFRVNAPKAQSVTVSIGPTTLTKGEDGFWTGITPPQNPGFHIYRLTIDGVELNDTASEAFWDAGGDLQRHRHHRRGTRSLRRQERSPRRGALALVLCEVDR